MTFIRKTRDCGCIVDINLFGANRYIKRCKDHPKILKNVRWTFNKKLN